MEKLIMLLDIYEEEVVGVHSVGDKITEKEEVWICSKKFGFIKWLVDNDKINRERCGFKNELFWNWYDKGIALVENYDNDTFKVLEFYRPYFQLLMLLSIQDEPIEFLISILK